MPGKLEDRARRRAEVRRRYYRGERQDEIALALGYSQAQVSRDIAFIQSEDVAQLFRADAEKRAHLLGEVEEIQRDCRQGFQTTLEPREIQDKSKTEGVGGSKSQARVRREPPRPNPRFLEDGLRCLEMKGRLLGLDRDSPDTLPPETQVELSDLDQPDEIRRLLYAIEGGTRDPLAQASDRFPRGFSTPQ